MYICPGMKSPARINATHTAEILQISRNSVNAAISVLKEKALIVRIGEDKGGYWEIIKR